MTNQQQPTQPEATEKLQSYQKTSDEIYPLPSFITRGAPDAVEPSGQGEPIQQRQADKAPGS